MLDRSGSSPKLDDKGQPVMKTQDRAVTKEDLANKEIPLPADLGEGDPYPVLKKDAAGKLVLEGRPRGRRTVPR